jgi:hypothetical protein
MKGLQMIFFSESSVRKFYSAKAPEEACSKAVQADLRYHIRWWPTSALFLAPSCHPAELWQTTSQDKKGETVYC